MPQAINITRSQLADFLRCERKYVYRHVEEVEPQFELGSVAMRQGTLGHYGLEAGYSYLRLMQQANPESYFQTPQEVVETQFTHAAMTAMAELVRVGEYKYRDTPQILGLLPDHHQDEIRAVGDAVQYYAKHNVWNDFRRYRIIATEVPVDWEYEIEGKTVVISGVIDLLAQDMSHEANVLVVADHKFVGDVSSSMAFLPLDIQLLTYETILANTFIPQGYDDVELVYNMIRREVPPGFGHRSLYTASGAKSKASTDPNDYLKRTSLSHSRAQRAHIESNFLIPALRRVVNLDPSGPLLPTVIRTGGEACATGCDFFARCKANMIGAGQPRFVNAT